MLEGIRQAFDELQEALESLNAAYLWEDLPPPSELSAQNAGRAVRHLARLYAELLRAYHYSPDSMFIADNRGTVKYLNRAFENYSGFSYREFIGRNVYDLESEGFFKPSSIRLALEEQREISIFQTGSAATDFYVKAVPVPDLDGNVEMVITSARSIPEIDKFYQYIHNGPTQKKAAEPQPLLMGNNPRMREILDIAQRVKDTDSTVLIHGESGVGKGVLARHIHESSNRREQPMVEVNCGAIPQELIESELFGYEGGAFTGANIKGKEGMFELAAGGTLLLDEIGEMPLALQVKLLKVIQDKQVLRIGGKKPVAVDVRIIAATNKDLLELVRHGQFRRDLYYRLNVIPLTIPPLRERREDIPVFSEYFLERSGRRYNKRAVFSKACMRQMQKYDWPGNIRELENCVERMVLINRDEMIDTMDLPDVAGQDMREIAELAAERQLSLADAMQEFERRFILAAYEKHHSSYKLSRALGISQASANRRIRKYITDEQGEQ